MKHVFVARRVMCAANAPTWTRIKSSYSRFTVGQDDTEQKYRERERSYGQL